MNRVVIESPFAGDVTKNKNYLRACMRDCIKRGESPYASHGLLTQEGVLDDRNPEERALGIAAGFEWRTADIKTAFYVDLGISGGMLRGFEHARAVGSPIEVRRLGDEALAHMGYRAPVLSLRDQVLSFMIAFQPESVHASVQVPDDATVRLRLRLVFEEAFELLRAAGGTFTRAAEMAVASLIEEVDASKLDLPEFIDATHDLDYVVEGTRVACGYNGKPGADAVHEANMAKLNGYRREDGKWMKPNGWQAPDIIGVLRAQGWVG